MPREGRTSPGHSGRAAHAGDFAPNTRLILLSAFAIVIGALSTVGAVVLLGAIRFFTKLFFFQTFSCAARSPAENHLGLAVIAAPVIGGLIVGLMARFGPRKSAATASRAYPVVDDGRLVGMVDREAITRMAANDALQTVGGSIAGVPLPGYALPGETCRTVAQRLATAGQERLRVVDDPISLRAVGILSRSDLLKPMRAQHEEESLRERVFHVMGSPDEGGRGESSR